MLTEERKSEIRAAVAASGYIFTGDRDELDAWATGYAMAVLVAIPLATIQYDFPKAVELFAGAIADWISREGL